MTNDRVSNLTDSRLRQLDDQGSDRALLESLNSDLLWIKRQLSDFRIGNNDVVINSLLSRIMDNDCGELSQLTPVKNQTVTVNRNGVITQETIS